MRLDRLASSLLALTLCLAPALARAQTAEERAAAHAEFERGVAAYTAHDYRSALDAFQEAYRLAPHASVRLNIANCYDQLDRPLEALFHFEHYLTEATGLSAAARRDVQASIDRLSARVGTLTLAVTPDGAAIVIDGGDTRRAPITEPVRVVAGDHVVEISLDGYVSERQTIHVDGGGTARVSIRLRRAEAVASSGGSGGAAADTTGAGGAGTETTVVATTTTSTTTTTEEPTAETAATTTSAETTAPAETTAEPAEGEGGGIRMTLPVWIAGGVTVAALVGWVVAGSIALAQNSAFENDVRDSTDMRLTPEERLAATDRGLGHADSARSAAIASDVLLATTLVGAGVTTFFFVLAQTEGDDEGSSDAASLLVAPVVGPGFAGLTAAGVF